MLSPTNGPLLTGDACSFQDKKARAGLEERMRVAADTLKEVFNELPNYNILIPVILKEVKEDRAQLCILSSY